MGTEELDTNMELILDALPEHHGSDRRKHALTRSDMELILAAIKLGAQSSTCSLNLTPDQAAVVVKMIAERKRALAFIGGTTVLILTYIGQKTLDLMAPDIWKRLAHSIGNLFNP